MFDHRIGQFGSLSITYVYSRPTVGWEAEKASSLRSCSSQSQHSNPAVACGGLIPLHLPSHRRPSHARSSLLAY